MKMNFESHNEQPELPDMDQGELVMNNLLAQYYERSMELEDKLRHATLEERPALEAELASVRASMKEADNIVSEGKEFPVNNSNYEIPKEHVQEGMDLDDLNKAA